MDRPDVESIETRLKELIAGPTYVESQTLIGYIRQLEADQALMIHKFNEDLENAIDFYGGDELKELREIGNEFIERRDNGEIRSTYTYNRFKKVLDK